MLKAVKTMQDADQNAIQEVPMQSVSLDIWDKKYRLKTKQGELLDQDVDDTYKRVARALERTPGKIVGRGPVVLRPLRRRG